MRERPARASFGFASFRVLTGPIAPSRAMDARWAVHSEDVHGREDRQSGPRQLASQHFLRWSTMGSLDRLTCQGPWLAAGEKPPGDARNERKADDYDQEV